MRELTSLPDVVRAAASRFGPQVALARTRAAGGGSLTYEALRLTALAGARRLRAAGLADGDRVLLTVSPRPEWAAALFSVLDAGLVAVPLLPGLDAERVRAIAAFADAHAVVADGAVDVGLRRTFAVGELLAPSDDADPPRPVGRDDLALLVFTSGSTASPRAVELTHGNVLSDLEALLAVRRTAPGDAFLSMLPPSHMFELVAGTLGPLACGARIVYPGALLPNRLVAALRDEGITHALAVPALVDALFREVRAGLEGAGLADDTRNVTPEVAAQRLRDRSPEERAAVRAAVRETLGPAFATMMVGGAASSPAWAEVLDAVGIRLDVGYGLTEAGPIVSVGYAAECPAGSVGRALPGVGVRIGDANEILVRGPNVMRGYFRDAAASADAFTDGHLRTGDVGRIDANGFLFVDGRIKEAMVSATGDTVFPEEMEPCYASPLFAERFVVPVPGADGNDVATLVVRPADRTRGDAVYRSEAARLRAAAPARLRYAAFHVLADAPLPRTATGKVRRRALGADIARRRAMREDELIAGLRALVGDVVRRDTSKLGPDDDIVAALVLDSLEALRVLALAEKRYAVQFDDAEVHEIRTLRRLADAVGRRRS
jgi:long-chain acyl-CoA synthetase